MSRFGDLDGDEGMPWGLWENVVSNALGGRRGQEALAALEAALVELPESKLIEGHLAADGGVCAVGALVARKRAEEQGVDIATIVKAMGTDVRCSCGHGRQTHKDGSGDCSGKGWRDQPCYCDEYLRDEGDIYETAEAGVREAGLQSTVAWHLAYLNDETFYGKAPEERYNLMLAWVRRAQGKEATAA